MPKNRSNTFKNRFSMYSMHTVEMVLISYGADIIVCHKKQYLEKKNL